LVALKYWHASFVLNPSSLVLQLDKPTTAAVAATVSSGGDQRGTRSMRGPRAPGILEDLVVGVVFGAVTGLASPGARLADPSDDARPRSISSEAWQNRRDDIFSQAFRR
jgi:hypothetical protein